MKSYFEYKGYIGTVALSVEDNCFFGTIQGINDLITFEGDTVDELRAAFQEAVDDYLVFCKECNVEPNKTYKGQFNVRIRPELHKAIALEAIKNSTSLNQMVEKAIISYLERKETPLVPVSVINITSRQVEGVFRNKAKGGWMMNENLPLKLVQGGRQ